MKICVYGASSNLIDKKYIDITEQFGRELVKHGHSVVTGGGANGLMGAVARGVYEQGGEIVGVAPRFFMDVDGTLFDRCNEMIYTKTMRERKQIMEDLSDAFVVTPGGIGTFEEFFEILTLKQLGRHFKPIVIFNIDGYYSAMNDMIERAIEQNFMKDTCRGLYKFACTTAEVLDYLEGYETEGAEVRYYKNM